LVVIAVVVAMVVVANSVFVAATVMVEVGVVAFTVLTSSVSVVVVIGKKLPYVTNGGEFFQEGNDG
jgi:hypothetical protein